MATNSNHVSPNIKRLFSVFKVIYIIIAAISFLIVALFLVFKLTIKPPAVEEPEDIVITIQPSANPTSPVEGDDAPADVSPEVTTIQLTRKEDFHTFLLLGTDDGNGNADTIMVGAYDLKNSKVSVLSVPRDTLVDVSRTVKKINGAYGRGGVTQLMDELEPILGFRPDHYIKVDLQAFVEVVNLLGGVDFYVPEDMYHNDGAGFIIDLKQGQQHLDGNKALQLVRYRSYKDQSSDLGRMKTQQKFLTTLAKQALSWSTVSKINEFAKIFATYFDTDLTVSEMAYFGIAALNLNFSSDVTMTTLPGDGNTTYLGIPYYYQLYPEECRGLINSMVNPYTTDIPEVLTNMFQVK